MTAVMDKQMVEEKVGKKVYLSAVCLDIRAVAYWDQKSAFEMADKMDVMSVYKEAAGMALTMVPWKDNLMADSLECLAKMKVVYCEIYMHLVSWRFN